jgi:hypothetical protein
MAENTPTKVTAPAVMVDSLYEPAADWPREAAPLPGTNVEVGPMRVVIPFVRGKLRDETWAVGASLNATFVDLTDDDQGYFKLLTRLWSQGEGFVQLEENVVPIPALVQELWDCPHEWCAGFFWAWDGAVMDGESRPQRPRRYRVSNTMALSKFGGSLLRRAPGVMRDAVARSNDRQHFNQLDLILVHEGGVLQGHPYNATPHVHAQPVDHRATPAWVPLIADDEWVSD